MPTWEKVSAEMWAEVDPDVIRFTTLFDEIMFVNGRITYQAHTPDQCGPLHGLFEEMRARFTDLSFGTREQPG